MSKFLDMTGLTHFKNKMINVVNSGLNKKVDKVTGKSLISDTEITRLAKVDNYDDSGIKADIKNNSDNIDTNKTNISTLAKHMTGDLTDSDFQEDSTVAMTKTVPAGISNYAAVKMIGGYTRKTVNLFDINSAPYITKVDDETFNMANHTDVVMTDFKADTQYTFSGYAKNNVSGGNVRFRLRYTDGSFEDIIKVDGSEYVYRQVTSQAGKSISDMIGYYGSSGNATFKQFQVQEGTTATSYEPYGQLWNAPIESVSSVYSKNLFPKKAVNLSYNSETAARLHIPAGNYVFSAIGSSTITINVIFKYIDGTSKTVSLGIDSTKRTAIAVTLTSTVVSISTYVNGNITINDVQLEKGKVMTAYEPYHETTLLIPDSIKNLPDYGVEGNVVDFENGTYTHTNTITDGAITALSTAETINISDILHPIRIEAGGTLTFTNEHNLDVPNTIVYKKEVSLNG